MESERHHEIPLRIGAEDERLVADLAETGLDVEAHRARVPLPHAEPQSGRALATGAADHGGHEVPGETAAAESGADVEGLELDRGGGSPARRRRAATQLRIGGERGA